MYASAVVHCIRIFIVKFGHFVQPGSQLKIGTSKERFLNFTNSNKCVEKLCLKLKGINLARAKCVKTNC